MAESKVTPKLRECVRAAAEDALVDVVVELFPAAARAPSAGLSRQDRAAAHRLQFLEAVAPLERWIERLGGEVLGHAWINQTLRARVPAGRVEQIPDAGNVASVDMPERISRD